MRDLDRLHLQKRVPGAMRAKPRAPPGINSPLTQNGRKKLYLYLMADLLNRDGADRGQAPIGITVQYDPRAQTDM